MKLSSINFKKQQRGISLLEVMLSLAIIAIVLSMAVRYFNIVSNNSKVNQTIQYVGEVGQAVTKCTTMGEGCNVTTATLSDMATTYTYLSPATADLTTNPFGGSFTYSAGTLTVGGLTDEVCDKLLARFPAPQGACSGGSFTYDAKQ